MLSQLSAFLKYSACTPVALTIVVGAAATNAILVNYYQPIHLWQYVLWEGGVVEWLTVLNLLGAGGLYLYLALTSYNSKMGPWFILFGVGCLFLAGEELNWGRGMLILNLDDPQFETRYNIQGGNLHNVVPAIVPVAVFIFLAGALRIAGNWSLRLVPVPVGFLNLVLVLPASILFMNLGEGRFLHLDEVLEWSSTTLILCLALHYRFHWFFLLQTEIVTKEK